MTLKERLNADFKEAMKNKEKVRKETISFVLHCLFKVSI